MWLIHRFFVSPENISDNLAYFSDEEARHIEKVMRMQTGEKIIIFDGSGYEYRAVLTDRRDNVLLAEITAVSEKEELPGMQLCLVQGIAKGDKMDNIIQKAVEIGVSAIYPMMTEHTVVRLQGEKATKKVQRWQHIVQEACKQCRRNLVPTVNEILTLDKIISEIGKCPAIMLYEKEDKNKLQEVLLNNKQVFADNKLFLLIGPEGGFSADEVNQAQCSGIITASLGPKILRTETAGMAASSIIMYEYGYLG